MEGAEVGLPLGTVTFLFTDIEGSTALLQHLGDSQYAQILNRHHDIFRTAFAQTGGRVIDRQGDAFFVAFPTARAAVTAALVAQQGFQTHPWPDGVAVAVRMGLHTGEPVLTGYGYVGLDVHRAARICGTAHGGQILLSEATHSAVQDHLPPVCSVRDLGDHRLKDLHRSERLYQLVHPDLPAEFPPLRSLSALPHNLPIQLTTFIGRERELADVKRLVSTRRLVTLIGAGGSGKTRLALQASAELIESFPDGVWLVDLAPLADAGPVGRAVASALGVREQPGRPLIQTITDAVRGKQLLLILDNCEHVIEACAVMAEALLRGCPHLKLIASSREGLTIDGEQLYRVPTLSLPAPRRQASPQVLGRSEAVRLFVDRAQLGTPQFVLREEDLSAVAQIVRRLDGIPLAIELAAARVRVLSPVEIVRRLDDRLVLLTRGARTALPRQQTLQGTIDWSYNLLTDPERALLRRLAVFAGGWTLEAAEAVTAGDGIDTSDVLDLLARLIDKSLVVVEESESRSVRYRFLEPVRQYTRARLRESGEEGAVSRRHLAWFLDLAEQAMRQYAGPDQQVWLDRIEIEHDNCRAALERAKVAGEAETLLRLCYALSRFWYVRGYFDEGRRWLDTALPYADQVAPILRARALIATATLARDQGDFTHGEALGLEALRLFEQLGNRRGVASAHHNLGLMASDQGRYDDAVAHYEHALRLWREEGERGPLALTLVGLGMVRQNQGEHDQTEALCGEALRILRELDDRWSLATCLNILGVTAQYRGAPQRAEAYHRESLQIQRELGSRRGAALSLNNLGLIAVDEGAHARAAQNYAESLQLFTEIGDRWGISMVIGNVALLLHGLGESRRGTVLFSFADALRTSIKRPVPPVEQVWHDRQIAALRSALGEAQFGEAWAAGQTLRLEDAIAATLAAAASISNASVELPHSATHEAG